MRLGKEEAVEEEQRGRDGKEERKQKKNYELLCHFKESGQAKLACYDLLSPPEYFRDLHILQTILER